MTAVSPSVVQIRTPEDFGSGVVVDDRGDVVTNAYVVGNWTRFVVTLASGAAKRVQQSMAALHQPCSATQTDVMSRCHSSSGCVTST